MGIELDTELSIADDLERYMLDLVNAARAQEGLHALALEQHLNVSAALHSDWMIQTDIFSHTGVNGSTAHERIVDAGFDLGGSWWTGENLALSTAFGNTYEDEVDAMFEGLMNSPGHRANILNENYDYIGIGIEFGTFDFPNNGGTWFSVVATQNFGATGGDVLLDTWAEAPAEEPGDAPATPQPDPDLPLEAVEIEGTSARDNLRGGYGNDNLMGRAGDDMIEGNDGRDRMIGNAGNDTVMGGADNDVLKGGSGVDALYGEDGNDRLKGNQHDDTLSGGSGNDRIRGNRGNDDIEGGAGEDVLMGGGEADTLDGGTGNDVLQGGRGSDVFVFRVGGDADRAADFDPDEDFLLFDAGLVDGLGDPAQMVATFADITASGVVFDFGNGDSLLLQGLDSTDGLETRIDLIV